MPGKKDLQDFVLTLSDGEDEGNETDEIEVAITKKQKRKSTIESPRKRQKVSSDDDSGLEMASDFEFQLDGDLQSTRTADDGESSDASFASFNSNDEENSQNSIPVPLPNSEEESSDSESSEDEAEQAFFAKADGNIQKNAQSFGDMHLSRPILKGLAAMRLSKPTPIQAQAIPIALMGKDIVASAVTGSGKTAAFMVPILDRLVYRSKQIATSRVVILLPTRELAVQCCAVGEKLASFTDITFCQLVGGFNFSAQQRTLMQRPDVIVATPGRFKDHMKNSQGFTIDTLEILVLDEADRMLEDGFAEELNEILITIPKSRQTMLFSATMTTKVARLIEVGLSSPARITIDAKNKTVAGLRQEFIRVRKGREDSKLAYLFCLCDKVFTQRCIIFFRQKKELHRICIMFRLSNFKVGELHGNLTQDERTEVMEQFRLGKISHLCTTNLAARGLDIKGVESVINFDTPESIALYMHRVGRTARAGRSGTACTFVEEKDRKLFKSIIKAGRAHNTKTMSRTVDPTHASTWSDKLQDMQGKLEEILMEERERKEMAATTVDLNKAEKIIDVQDDTQTFDKPLPKRTKVEKIKARFGPNKRLSNKAKKKIQDWDDRKKGSIGMKKTSSQRVKSSRVIKP